MSTRQSRYETVGDGATRVIAATESFYFAKGIGPQASAGAAVDEEQDSPTWIEIILVLC